MSHRFTAAVLEDEWDVLDECPRCAMEDMY